MNLQTLFLLCTFVRRCYFFYWRRWLYRYFLFNLYYYLCHLYPYLTPKSILSVPYKLFHSHLKFDAPWLRRFCLIRIFYVPFSEGRSHFSLVLVFPPVIWTSYHVLSVVVFLQLVHLGSGEWDLGRKNTLLILKLERVGIS